MIIVVGGGHAGCESAYACSKIGFETMLITGDKRNIATLPCNPSIGGPAKGIVVSEIDALGGIQGKLADLTQIQVKMLNESKGPAVRSIRMQIDKVDYPREMLKLLENTENLTIKEGLAESLLIVDDTVRGVILQNGEVIEAEAVILTTGTYLNSQTLRGNEKKLEGPDGQPTTFGISNQLRELGFDIIRLKTGTPARVITDSIDFSQMEIQEGSSTDYFFSCDERIKNLSGHRVPCYLLHTTPLVHKIILDNIHLSAMYSGEVRGTGPRYCPSIEDKLVRFSNKERHQLFLEPESLTLPTTYLQGFSTSMPKEIQDQMIRALPGLEKCIIEKYAYAIEYDAIEPTQLWPSLETKKVKNLFTAGQINGTSGYEEAACQGLIAGINATLKLRNQPPLVLRRDEAYIGVLIDDLVTKGTKEPYRLLTSRAEHRLLLRHDNAVFRLREYGYKVGLIDDDTYKLFTTKRNYVITCTEQLKKFFVTPSRETNSLLAMHYSANIINKISLYDLLKRPEIDSSFIINYVPELPRDILMIIETNAKYEGYIIKAMKQAERDLALESKIIPESIDYDNVSNIALEAKDKLKKIRPKTLGQASRISGVNPSDMAVLAIYVKQMGAKIND